MLECALLDLALGVSCVEREWADLESHLTYRYQSYNYSVQIMFISRCNTVGWLVVKHISHIVLSMSCYLLASHVSHLGGCHAVGRPSTQ